VQAANDAIGYLVLPDSYTRGLSHFVVGMASQSTSGSHIELYDSTLTVPSDSENYSANNELSSSPASSSSSPLALYRPPTLWSILRGAAINLILPFVNGLMLGLGELVAHETAFRLGWSGTKIFPTYRRSRPVASGIEVREIPPDKRRTYTTDL